ncbi:hypothetical protein ABNF97_07220 [Plantactinospora sp. B6F1]|uniref:hypothetical protein n=1 Tax=Plantactinospora sp. B6F1 TaxID=3158971 RepID=UPI0032D9016B
MGQASRTCRNASPGRGRGGAQLAGLAVLAGLLTATACTTGPAEPTAAPSPPAGTESVPNTSATPDGPGRTYDAVGLDLCARTSLAPLADLSLTVQQKIPKQPTSAPGAACLFEFRARGGHEASLLVEASTLGSPDEAGRLYRATQRVSGMSRDGVVAGIGEEAEGFTEQSESGAKRSEYMIHSRAGNLVLKVWLAVGGTEFTPKDVLAAKVKQLLTATLAEVP